MKSGHFSVECETMLIFITLHKNDVISKSIKVKACVSGYDKSLCFCNSTLRPSLLVVLTRRDGKVNKN